jgi:salicylate hydroxylase
MSAAIALRAPGREITILERSALASEIGATISLQPNASRILQSVWNVDSMLEARGIVDHGFRIFNTDGNMVNSIPLLNKDEYGGHRVMYHRQDLHSCLIRAATSEDRKGAAGTIRTSARVISCDYTRGTVTLDGGEELSADLM